MEADQHVPDAQLLLHSGGEMPAASSAMIAAHLQTCSLCRTRLKMLESSLDEFARADFEAGRRLRSAAVSRARLQESLAELKAQNGESAGRGPEARRKSPLPVSWVSLFNGRETAIAAIAMAACLLFAIWYRQPVKTSFPLSASQPHSEEPDLRLTPGAILPLTQSQVCGAEAARITANISASLKRKVFEEYGVAPSRPDAYEVDYLITPELGGATDIRNLWPEPYEDTVWNAHVKDQLEDRLHRLVCHGDVDLATAQRDISADWIAAYRKYFHADKPVAEGPSFDSSETAQPRPLT